MTPIPDPRGETNGGPKSVPNDFSQWMQVTAGARTFFDLCVISAPSNQRQQHDDSSVPAPMETVTTDSSSCFSLVAIACHLNCVLVGKLNDPPSSKDLNERLLTLGLLHMHKENCDRLNAHEMFTSDAACRNFVERLNIHLDHPVSTRQQTELEMSIASIFRQNAPILRVLSALAAEAEDASRSDPTNVPDSHHDLHVAVEIPKGNQNVNFDVFE